MKIFIAGAGEVGTHLAKLLSTENHDIVLLDSDHRRLDFAYDNNFEIMPVMGNPTSMKDLKMAGAGEAELFISVTPEESMNIVACILASKLGAKKTMARINNNEYLNPDKKAFLATLGIHDMVYPELLAAKEIVSGLQLPWTRQYWSLFDGKLDLLAVKIEPHSRLVGRHLYELGELERKLFHIVAVRRTHHTFIPTGADVIQAYDIVFFTCAPEDKDTVRQFCGKEDVHVKKVFIMGGSRIALRVAELLPSDFKIKIIELDHDHCKRLIDAAPSNVMVINGDARDPRLIKEEGIELSQAFLALTANSEANMLATVAAKRMGVYRTVARIENIDYLDIAVQMDIGNLINKKLLAAASIFRHLLNIDISNVKCLSIGQADVLEIVATPSSKITKVAVKDLKLPKGITLGGLLRDGEAHLIHGNTVIMPKDVVMVFCVDTPMSRIKSLFA